MGLKPVPARCEAKITAFRTTPTALGKWINAVRDGEGDLDNVPFNSYFHELSEMEVLNCGRRGIAVPHLLNLSCDHRQGEFLRNARLDAQAPAKVLVDERRYPKPPVLAAFEDPLPRPAIHFRDKVPALVSPLKLHSLHRAEL